MDDFKKILADTSEAIGRIRAHTRPGRPALEQAILAELVSVNARMALLGLAMQEAVTKLRNEMRSRGYAVGHYPAFEDPAFLREQAKPIESDFIIKGKPTDEDGA